MQFKFAWCHVCTKINIQHWLFTVKSNPSHTYETAITELNSELPKTIHCNTALQTHIGNESEELVAFLIWGIWQCGKCTSHHHLVYPLTARVIGAPQMILQPFSPALWDLANSRPVHSLMLSSQLFLCLPCLLPPFTVPCKMVLARYHSSLCLFKIVRRSSCGPIACWILAQTSWLVIWSL